MADEYQEAIRLGSLPAAADPLVIAFVEAPGDEARVEYIRADVFDRVLVAAANAALGGNTEDRELRELLSEVEDERRIQRAAEPLADASGEAVGEVGGADVPRMRL